MQPTDRAGWRSTCNRPASERSSGQSSLCTAPSAPVAASLAGQLVTAVQSPCFRDARRAQREAESTHPFHIIRHLTAISPCRSCVFPTQLASGAALRPAIEGKIEGDGASRSESIEKSTRHSGGANLIACRFLQKGQQTQRSQRHCATEQSSRSYDCASPRAFRSFRWRVRASMIPSTPLVAAAIAGHRPNCRK
jgi:hypothetical protein